MELPVQELPVPELPVAAIAARKYHILRSAWWNQAMAVCNITIVSGVPLWYCKDILHLWFHLSKSFCRLHQLGSNSTRGDFRLAIMDRAFTLWISVMSKSIGPGKGYSTLSSRDRVVFVTRLHLRFCSVGEKHVERWFKKTTKFNFSFYSNLFRKKMWKSKLSSR